MATTYTTVKISELEAGDTFVHPTVRNYSEVEFAGVDIDGVRYCELDGRSGVWTLLGWDADDEVKVAA